MTDKKKEKEAEFYRRIAELRSKNNQFPWTSGEIPIFELPKEQTKLFADSEADGSEMSNEELERRVLMDLVAPTYNFRTFYKRLNYELRRANRYDRKLTLLIVAVDGLDEIFRIRGPEVRDNIVSAAAAVMLTSIRDVDLIGRCREDAFGIILPETPRTGAEVAAERIRTRLEEYEVVVKGRSYLITASVGVACFLGKPLVETGYGQGPSVEEVFGAAASAVMKCMKNGGNEISFADDNLEN